jgi:anti-sigma regulatory factor (Ser/Thr protein kinase)
MVRPVHNSGLSPYTPRDTFRFPAERAAVSRVRREVRATLGRWGLDALGDDAVLVVTELFTNALLHTAGRHVGVALWTAGRSLYVEVADQGGSTTHPVPHAADIDDEGGRGLMLVEQLTQRWGVQPLALGRGKSTWAAISLSPHDR